ncbi:MAG TPA: DUF2339 domain-containing protein [Solirubrobacterales bacterium]
MEGNVGSSAPTPTPTPTPPVQPPRVPSESPLAAATAGRAEQRRPEVGSSATISAASFEDLFGGRILAWIGGLAILLGSILFLGMAISNGWLDEPTRIVIAAFGSTVLLIVGVWLHERNGRPEAALAAVASSISGLFATLVVATQAYELVSPAIGLSIGALIAAVGLLLAVRWSSIAIAAIGIVGALAAPVLVGTDVSGTSIAFVATALAACVAILVWQRWDWLALAAFAISAPQIVAWVSQEDGERLALTLPVLIGFWALYAVAAFGYEIRSRDEGLLPIASWLLLLGSSALVVGAGYYALYSGDAHAAGVIWVLGMAALHVGLGTLALRLGLNREIGSMLIGLGLALSAFGLADALDGPALVAAWSAEAVVLAYLARRFALDGTESDAAVDRLLFVAAGFLGLAVAHILALEAPPSAIVNGLDDFGGAVGGVSICLGAIAACGYLLRDLDPRIATVAGVAGAGSLVYLVSLAIVDLVGVSTPGEAQAGQVWLSAFWAATGLGAVVAGLVRHSSSVRLGGLSLLGLAIAKVWTYDLAELDDLARVLSFVGLGLLLLIGAFAYHRLRPGGGGSAPGTAEVKREMAS